MRGSEGFPGGSAVKNLPAKQETQGDSISGSGRSPGEENGNPLQYFCLENPMDKGAWRAIVLPPRLDEYLSNWLVLRIQKLTYMYLG